MSDDAAWKETDRMSPTPEQERAMEDAERVPCVRCGNPTRRLFAITGWDTCERCTADELEEQDMRALRHTVERKRGYGRRW